MSFVKPFCGMRYNPKTIPDAGQVASWPYDCISKEDQDTFYKNHEYNIIRLIKAKESVMDSGTDNKYTRAAADLNHWQENGILVTDPAPAFYYYRMGYTSPNGTHLVRKGFIGLMKLCDYEQGIVLPHESIDPEPLADRLELMKATGANLSPVFVTYSDYERDVLSLLAGSLPSDPIIKTIFQDDTEHTIWRVTDPDVCNAISAAMENRQIMIADGHHRYEAALKFRDIARERFPEAGPDAPFEYVLTYFCPMEDGGITVLPTHRSVSGNIKITRDQFLMDLSQSFYIKEITVDPEQKEASLVEAIEEARVKNEKDETFIMGLEGADSLFLLNFKKDAAKTSYSADVPLLVRSLDVAILQKVIFHRLLGIDPEMSDENVHVEYFTDGKELFSRIENGAKLVFLLNPTKIETLWTLAQNRQMLPVKSSYFSPKVLAGFVLHKF